MSLAYYRSGVTGGTEGDLDYLDPLDAYRETGGPLLADGDVAFVISEGDLKIYLLHESAGAVEAFPDVIIPDQNAGNFWWELINTNAPSARKYSYSNVAQSATLDITHATDSAGIRIIQVWEDGQVSGDYTVTFDGTNTTHVTKDSAGTATLVEVIIYI